VKSLPPGTRLILASENLLDEWGTRTERGDRITLEWGAQRPEGWYEPTVTVHRVDLFDETIPLSHEGPTPRDCPRCAAEHDR
jgi:hypothetical protein